MLSYTMLIITCLAPHYMSKTGSWYGTVAVDIVEPPCVLRDHIVSAPKGRVLAYILDSCVLWGVSKPDPKNEKHEKWHPIKSHNPKIDSLLKGKLKTKNIVNGWA